MLMKLPDSATHFDFEGKSYHPDENGLVEIPEGALRIAKALGLKAPGEEPPAQVERPAVPTIDELQGKLDAALKQIHEMEGAIKKQEMRSNADAKQIEAQEAEIKRLRAVIDKPKPAAVAKKSEKGKG